MKTVQNKFHLDFPLSLQEEFAPYAALRGRFAAGVVATEGSVESLPLTLRSRGASRRGRMPPSGMISEEERQAQCRACRDIEGLFESLLNQSFGE